MKTSTFNFSHPVIMAALFFSIFFPHQTFGQSFPLEVSRADLVFDGKISSRKGVWSSDKSTIYTLNWFLPSSIYAGNTGIKDSIPVLTSGGLTDEGVLIATHSTKLYSGYSYLLALEPCLDCVQGMTTWRIKGSIGEFKQKEYLVEQAKWANKPRVKSYLPETTCQGNEEVLYLSFGNIHLVPGLDSTVGHIDVRTRTTQNAKFLQSLATNIKYSGTIFGDYAIASHAIGVSPIGADMQQSYSSTASDLTSNKAAFAMNKNPSSPDAFFIETFFTPTARIAFKIPTSSLSNLPTELENLLSLETIEATYLCEGRTYSFRDIIIVKGDIGVEIEGAAAGVVYQFENVSYNSSTEEYSFEIFASSSEETYLNVANIKIDFSATAFLPFQVGNMHLQVLAVQNGVLGINNNYDIDPPQDLDASSVEVNMFAVNTDDFINLVLLDGTPRPLFGVSLKADDCETNPGLNFIPGAMQGLSKYFQPSTFPLPLVYDPVLAIDQENTPPCGCDLEPVITGYSPTTPLVAGDGQVLTITGDNFGVYERSGNPEISGTGSSVFFTNGDMGDNDPLVITASDDDIVSWTNTEIKVKIPSVDYSQGLGGTAASGPFYLRNRCNNPAASDIDLPGEEGILDIRYSLATYRISDDGPARKLGLRNDNGMNGGQDGYAFAFGSTVTGPNINIDIKEAFGKGLDVWCGVTNIRFKTQQAVSPTDIAAPNDGVNSITVEDIDEPGAEGGMVQGFAYFPINCQATPSNENGGLIMTDIDFKIDPDFAENGTQSRAIEVFTHELGHAHMLKHALCPGASCTEPIMEATGGAGVIQQSDSDGANRVFNRSADIINSNTCILPGSGVVDPLPIQQGDCGIMNPTFETNPLHIQFFPNPANSFVTITRLPNSGKFSLFNSSGKLLQAGDVPAGEFHLDLPAYSQGAYFVNLVFDMVSSHFKIIKL